MTMKEFIKRNRKELDEAIAHRLKMDSNPRPSDEERRLWVLNDEELYGWARWEGVKC